MEQVPPEQITTILLQNFQHDFDEILTLIVKKLSEFLILNCLKVFEKSNCLI